MCIGWWSSNISHVSLKYLAQEASSVSCTASLLIVHCCYSSPIFKQTDRKLFIVKCINNIYKITRMCFGGQVIIYLRCVFLLFCVEDHFYHMQQPE